MKEQDLLTRSISIDDADPLLLFLAKFLLNCGSPGPCFMSAYTTRGDD